MQIIAHNKWKPSHPEIARRAYELWEAEGRPHGGELQHWLRAETELMARLRATAGGKKPDPRQPSRRNRYGLILQRNSVVVS
jgi:hypothetical protein